jgi:membrane protein implicated in regulation of membrane protease activity
METFEMTWWMWMVLALALAGLEILTPGTMFAIFFAVGAAVVGLLALFGVTMGIAGQGLIFVSVSACALLLLRKPLMERLEINAPTTKVDDLIGETAQALEDIAADAIGKAELRGSAWSARNIGGATITRAGRCRVERIEGLMLFVRGS